MRTEQFPPIRRALPIEQAPEWNLLVQTPAYISLGAAQQQISRTQRLARLSPEYRQARPGFHPRLKQVYHASTGGYVSSAVVRAMPIAPRQALGYRSTLE